jgi:hypothetical protein
MLSFLSMRTPTSVCAGRSLFRASPHCLSQGMKNKTISLHSFPRASRQHSVFMSRSRATYPVSSLIQISSRYLERQIASGRAHAQNVHGRMERLPRNSRNEERSLQRGNSHARSQLQRARVVSMRVRGQPTVKNLRSARFHREFAFKEQNLVS